MTLAVSWRAGARPAVTMPQRLTLTPAEIPSAMITAWYDASQITGLADAAAVSQWNDLGPAGRHQAQATAGKQPSYRTNVINGLPVVRFAAAGVPATDDFLNCTTNLPTETSGAVFAVVKPSANDATARAWLSMIDAAFTDSFVLGPSKVSSVDSVYLGSSGNAVTGPGATASAVSVVTAESSGTAWSIYQNGVAQSLVTTGVNNGDWFGDISSAANFTVGGLRFSGDNNNYWPYAGDIGEIVVLNTVPSAYLRNRITGYLGAKWGVAV